MSQLRPFVIPSNADVWITSDTHFSHTNIAGPSVSSWKSGYRNFESVHEMNKALTE